MKVQCIAVGLLFALASAEKQGVTPIEKVITLLTDLKTEIQDEATAEADTYDKFACFCKDTTGEKSTAITEGNVNIDDTTATIQEKSAALAEKETELAKYKKQIEALTIEIEKAEHERAIQKAEYEKVKADLDQALSQMTKAIEALEASKPELIEIKRVIRRSVAMADVLDLKVKHRRQIDVFLQTKGTQDPKEEYEFQSQGIIDTLKELKADFEKNLDDKNTEEEKSVKAHEFLMGEKDVMKSDAESAKDETEGAIADLKEAIADAKEKLVGLQATLADDQLYLKDLTARCEVKAREWDQRSQMRADEVEAITKAIGVIEGQALGVEADRAMLQTQQAADSESQSSSEHKALNIMEDDIGDLGLALMQETQGRSTIRSRALKFLNKAAGSMTVSEKVATSQEARKQKVLDFLGREGRRLGSATLVTMALKLGPDPFKKVKVLIQALIERLLKEMAEEAGHKGFCDTELGKAKTSRDFEHEKTWALSADLEKLENKMAVLKETIVTLTDDLSALHDDLEKGTKMRGEEKESNEETITKSTEGLAAITEAISILKDFYKQAAKALLLQSRASPIDEDPNMPDAPPGGSYKGKQDQAGNIIGMLEVIKSDFERSIKQTTQAEKEAHRAFVDFDRQSKGSISSKETEKGQCESDLEETKISIKEKMAGLQEAQTRIDDSLKAIEELKPVCIDTGMSYAERVAKREEEIKALKSALCQLDTEGVESECK